MFMCMYQQNVFRRGWNMAESHILNRNDQFCFVSMRIKKKSEFSVNRSDFDSRCKPGVSCSWMEFDFCFAFENSRSFKTVICSTNSSGHCSSRDAEHICLTAFVGAVTKSKWGGLVWKLKNRCRQKLQSTLENCTTIQRTPSQGIVQRDFSIFEGMKRFYYRHSVKKCTKYPFDSRIHRKTVRRLWFPTSDRLEIWLFLSGTIRSKQYHESTMVSHNLPSYHLW